MVVKGSEGMKSFGEDDILKGILSDKPVFLSHIAVYVALLQLWQQNKRKSPFQVSRKKIMHLAHIKSIVTYHQCIRDLQKLGYIDYEPSYHPREGSRVYLEDELTRKYKEYF